MNAFAIRAEGLSKSYRIGGREQYLALRDVLSQALSAPARLMRKMLDRNRGMRPQIWALKDVSFEIGAGEAVGIVGRNGAGKSTLLRLLSRITRPTAGYAEVHGRIGSILEVGTGFHPELTGRENVYLSGALLGMKKREIDSKFDEIVEFAWVEKFIDTPVKHFSSGMYVRLAFAVAAHLETEILLIDEVLAVGDVAFQKRCLGKMGDVARQGRTVLFVSHNMAAIQQLTRTSLLFQDGALACVGPSPDVVGRYLNDTLGRSGHVYNLEGVPRRDERLKREIELFRLEFRDHAASIVPADGDIDIYVTVRGNDAVERFRFGLTVFRLDGAPVGSVFGPETLSIRRGELGTFRMRLHDLRLAPGRYYCSVSVGTGNHLRERYEFDYVSEVLDFEMMAPEGEGGTRGTWYRPWGSVWFPEPEVSRISSS